jgi:hypothetical protein
MFPPIRLVFDSLLYLLVSKEKNLFLVFNLRWNIFCDESIKERHSLIIKCGIFSIES